MRTENLHKTYASGPPPREGRRQRQAEKCISAEVAFPQKDGNESICQNQLFCGLKLHALSPTVTLERINGTFFEMIGAGVSFLGETATNGTTLSLTVPPMCGYPQRCREDEHNGGLTHLIILDILHNVVSLPRLPQNKQMF